MKHSAAFASLLACSLTLSLPGCSDKKEDSNKEDSKQTKKKTEQEQVPQQEEPSVTPRTETQSGTPVVIKPLTLGSDPQTEPPENPPTTPEKTPQTSPTEKKPLTQSEKVVAALDPLQILIGEWEGKTAKVIAGAKAIEEPLWKWDFKTNPEQPALVMTSQDNPYITEASLTYLTDSQEYQLTAVDAKGTNRIYQGTFSQPVRDEIGDDNKLNRTYKLKLTQTSPEPKGQELVFNQQENNRYLLEIYRARGNGNLVRYDTIATQRQGTSFALSAVEYGEKECVVSGGLGTSTVSYQGKTFYVCCSGCRAAFDDDPEKWIAKYEARKKEKE